MVADGDTITILDPSKSQRRVRLLGIDAPESRQAFGTRSKQHLSDVVFNREVVVEFEKRDRYGRVLGKVIAGGRDVNPEQVRSEMAWHYKYYQQNQSPRDRRVYAEAEDEARAAVTSGPTINSTDGVIPYRSSSTSFADSPLVRGGANTVEQYNGTSAQTFNLYNTRTSATNYQRLAITWISNVATIRPENQTTGGTHLAVYGGSGGDLKLGANQAERWLLNGARQLYPSGATNSYDLSTTSCTIRTG